MTTNPDSLREVLAALKRAERTSNCTIIDLMNAISLDPKEDFRGGKWRGGDFSNLSLAGFNFCGADLRNARFHGSTLKGTKFQGAKITPTNIITAKDWRDGCYDDDQWLALIRSSLAALPTEEMIDQVQKIEEGPKPLTDPEWVAIIKSARNYSDARRLLTLMNKRREEPSRFAYSAAISKSPSFFTAQKDFSEFISAGGVIDSALYSTLIDRVEQIEDAWELLDEMIAQGQVPDDYAFNSILKIAVRIYSRNHSELETVVTTLEGRGMKIGQIGYNILVGAASTAEEAITILDRMVDEQLPLRPQDINQAIRVLPEWEVPAIIQYAEANSVPFDEISFNLVIRKQKSAYEAIPWLDRMSRAGFAADLHTLKAILRCANEPLDGAIGLTILQRRGVNVYRWDAVHDIAELTLDEQVIDWVRRMREDMETPKGAMRRLFDRIFSQVPRDRYIWTLVS